MLYKIKNKTQLKINLVKSIIGMLANNCDEPIELNEENLNIIYKMTAFNDFEEFKTILFNIMMQECFVCTNENGVKSVKFNVKENRKARKLDFEDLKNSILKLYEEEKI